MSTLPPDWIRRGVSSVTTIVNPTVSVPAGTVDGDLMIMDLAHDGGVYATVTGWTLVDQGIQSSIRGEMYWRRASTEPASYTITAGTTLCRAVITTYAWPKQTGSVVSVSSKGTAAAGVATGAPTITPPDSVSLLHAVYASDASETVAPLLLRDTSVVPNLTPDSSCRNFVTVASSTAAGICLIANEVVKVSPSMTGDAFKQTSTGNHVVILAAFIPDITRTDTKTRYYLTTKYPTQRLVFPPNGTWDESWISPRGFDHIDYVWELSQAKAAGGQIYGLTHNQEQMEYNEAPLNALYRRWVSPPLTAQTISGTFNYAVAFCREQSSGWGTEPNPFHAVKVHITLIDGATQAVKAVLLDNYIDASSTNSATLQFFGPTAPPTLTPATASNGDRLHIEIGVHIESSSAFPLPVTKPPSVWQAMRGARGSTLADAISISDARLATLGASTDGVAGNFFNLNSDAAPWIEFSQVLDHQAPAGSIPTNTTCAAATVINSIPFDTGEIDTTRVASGDRQLWYKWTAPVTDRFILISLGTVYGVQTDLYDACNTTTSSPDRFRRENGSGAGAGGDITQLNAQAGKTYYIQVSELPDKWNAPSCGGSMRLRIFQRQAPANNDVIYPHATGFVMRYTFNGILADVFTDYKNSKFSGAAIDYTKRPYPQVFSSDPNPNTNDRLHLAVFTGSFTANGFVEVFDLPNMYQGSGVADLDGSLPVVNGGTLGNNQRDNSSISIRADGQIVCGYFGDGFSRVADGFASYQKIQAGGASADLNIGDTIYNTGSPLFDPTAPMTVIPATLEAGGTNYVEWDDAGENVYYTSGGWYFPVGGVNVYRYNVASNTISLFATLPLGTGQNPGAKGLFPLPKTPTTPLGGLLVCNGTTIYRLDTNGIVVNTYVPTSSRGNVMSLADVELQADGRYFWAMDEGTSTFFKFDMQTGLQVLELETGLVAGASTSFVIYRTTPFPPAPTLPAGCVADLPNGAASSRAGCVPSI